jgi:endonuclease-3 related protein
MPETQKVLINMYYAMYEKLGPSYWWPGDSVFEICLGAILTQNTNWNNVEKAIINLKANKLLDPKKLFFLSDENLASLIRPAGYYRIKTRRLKNFLMFLKKEVDFNIERLKKYPTQELRKKLLSIKGVGPETADSMLLYGFEKEIFVVDAYTARIFNRHSLVEEDITYDELQDFCMRNLPCDVELYKEFHALIVRTGKKWCKKKRVLCGDCPLSPLLNHGLSL